MSATSTSPTAAGTTDQLTQAVGIDIIPGVIGYRRLRALREAELRRGATWSRALILGSFTEALPVARPSLGVMLLSGWRSSDDRLAFHDADEFRELQRASRVVSLDLGSGIARSQHRDLTLEDDGWLERLPAGRAPRGVMAGLTYARLTPRGVLPFQRLARAVTLSARSHEGFIASAFGTEFRYPVFRVMSLTLWEHRTYSQQWAYSGDVHMKAIHWLFDKPELMPGGCVGRFSVLGVAGKLDGVDLPTAVRIAESKPRPKRAATPVDG
jgi:heme-degrading monooxygenase HmoA